MNPEILTNPVQETMNHSPYVDGDLDYTRTDNTFLQPSSTIKGVNQGTQTDPSDILLISESNTDDILDTSRDAQTQITTSPDDPNEKSKDENAKDRSPKKKKNRKKKKNLRKKLKQQFSSADLKDKSARLICSFLNFGTSPLDETWSKFWFNAPENTSFIYKNIQIYNYRESLFDVGRMNISQIKELRNLSVVLLPNASSLLFITSPAVNGSEYGLDHGDGRGKLLYPISAGYVTKEDIRMLDSDTTSAAAYVTPKYYADGTTSAAVNVTPNWQITLIVILPLVLVAIGIFFWKRYKGNQDHPWMVCIRYSEVPRMERETERINTQPSTNNNVKEEQIEVEDPGAAGPSATCPEEPGRQTPVDPAPAPPELAPRRRGGIERVRECVCVRDMLEHSTENHHNAEEIQIIHKDVNHADSCEEHGSKENNTDNAEDNIKSVFTKKVWHCPKHNDIEPV